MNKYILLQQRLDELIPVKTKIVNNNFKWQRNQCLYLKLNKADIERFNKIYLLVKENIQDRIIWTNTTISTKTAICAYDITNKNDNWIRLTIRLMDYLYTVKIDNFYHGREKTEKGMNAYPLNAFSLFKKLCTENGIDLDEMRIDNGADVKNSKDFPKYLVHMNYHMLQSDAPLEHCNHIDFHSSFPAGLCNTHPEFRKVIEPLYEGRKDHPEYKNVLNFTIGWMQSLKNGHKAEWAHLAKDAIADNNKRIRDMELRLMLNGNRILGFNTDGIWYQGPVYHGDGEGPNLGQWHNDYVDCLFRSKSNGVYEFIHDGVYTPIYRGVSSFEMIKRREDWEWGDIYQGEVVRYYFDLEKGMCEVTDDE